MSWRGLAGMEGQVEAWRAGRVPAGSVGLGQARPGRFAEAEFGMAGQYSARQACRGSVGLNRLGRAGMAYPGRVWHGRRGRLGMLGMLGILWQGRTRLGRRG
jgi:hypothetical protein